MDTSLWLYQEHKTLWNSRKDSKFSASDSDVGGMQCPFCRHTLRLETTSGLFLGPIGAVLHQACCVVSTWIVERSRKVATWKSSGGKGAGPFAESRRQKQRRLRGSDPCRFFIWPGLAFESQAPSCHQPLPSTPPRQLRGSSALLFAAPSTCPSCPLIINSLADGFAASVLTRSRKQHSFVSLGTPGPQDGQLRVIML